MLEYDIFLMLPPTAMMLVMPELGLPQLSAYLRGRGRKVRVSDLNMYMLFEYISRPGPSGIIEERIKSPVYNPAAEKISPFIDRRYPNMSNTEMMRYTRNFTNLLNPPSTWQLEDMLDAVGRPDCLFDGFFDRYIAGAVSGSKVAGFEILTHTQIPAAFYFARRIKKEFPKVKVVFGGPWATASRPAVKHWEKLFGITDFICFYSGEGPTDALIDFADGKKGIEEIPGVAYLKDGKVNENALPPALDIRKTPLPDFSDLPLDLYPKKALPYQNSAGCEWGKCTFCYHCFPKNRYYEKDTARSADEMKCLADKYGIRDFSLADLSVPHHTLGLLSACLVKNGADITWDALTRADKPYTDKFARLLRVAGCRELFIGVEIPDKEELDRLNKGISRDSFERTAAACASAGITVSVFLLNYPGLKKEKYLNGLKYFQKLNRTAHTSIDAIVADFELGRSSNAMKHLDEFGIKLPEDTNTDLRSFCLPFETDLEWNRSAK